MTVTLPSFNLTSRGGNPLDTGKGPRTASCFEDTLMESTFPFWSARE